MSIDPLSEELLSLAQAARRLPRLCRGHPVHASTLWRWAREGLRGVHLETVMIGGRRVTSVEGLRRFFAALSRQDAVLEPAPSGQQDDAVENELIRIGL